MRFVLLSILVSITNFYYAQTYDIGTENGNTITTCSGVFVDAGGGSDYGNNETYEVTFCSDNGEFLAFDFMDASGTALELGNGDTLFVYDGIGTSGDLIDILERSDNESSSNFNSLKEYSPIYNSTCVTFLFKSNGSGVDEGWNARISCSSGFADCNGNPAPSDVMGQAPLICNLDGYCGTTSGNYSSDLPYNMGQGGNCPSSNAFLGTVENNSWLSFVAGSSDVSFTFDVQCGLDGIQAAILKYNPVTGNMDRYSPCSLSDGGNGNSNSSFDLTGSGLTVGETYYLMIDGNQGAVCDYTITTDPSSVITVDAGQDQTICDDGTTATLTANGPAGATFEWTSTDPGFGTQTGQSIVVSPTTTHTYTVEITGGVPCAGETDDVVVNVQSCTTPSCGDCGAPTCEIGNYADYATTEASHFPANCVDYLGNEIEGPTLYKSYHTVSVGANGTFGAVVSSGVGAGNPGCNITRSFELFPLAGPCTSGGIAPDVANANGSAFSNPEWTSLTPNTDYILVITFDIPASCELVDHCQAYYEPPITGCNAAIGTFTTSYNSTVTPGTVFDLAPLETFSISANGDATLPPVASDQAGVGYAAFTCDPATQDLTDASTFTSANPCFAGFHLDGNYSDINDGSGSGAALGVTTFWLVPVTFDDICHPTRPSATCSGDNSIGVDINGDDCFDVGTPIQINYVDQQCGTCTTPDCPVAQVGSFNDRTYLVCNDPIPDNEGTFTTCHTLNSGTYGSIGLVQLIEVYPCTGANISRTYELRAAVGGVCSGGVINPTVTNANGLGSGFNPEWEGLTPNTDYIVCITSTVPNGCFYDSGCLDYYNPTPSCTALVGTDAVSLTGNGTEANAPTYALCSGDQLDITTTGANPSVDYAIYTCAPTNSDPALDACYTGYYFEQLNAMSEISAGDASPVLAFLDGEGISYSNNTIWWVPIATANIGQYDPSCYQVGSPYQTTYLNEITVSEVEDCANGTVTLTISGGYPEFFSGAYNFTNTGAGTLSDASLTPSSPGASVTLIISGLNDTDAYSLTITDDNGCPMTYAGGTFSSCACVAPVITVQPLDDCQQEDLNNAVTSAGGGNLSFYASLADAQAATNPIANAVTSSGPYFVRSEDQNDNTCFATEELDVTITPIIISVASSNPSSCGASDGCLEITVSTPDVDYEVSIDGAPATTMTAIGNVISICSYAGGDAVSSVDVTEVLTSCNAVETSGWNFTAPGAPVITFNNGDQQFCGTATGVTLDASVSSGVTSWSDGTNTFSNGDNVAPSVTTTYTFTADDAGCLASESFTITIDDNPTFTVTTQDPTCGNVDGEVSVLITGVGNYEITLNNGTPDPQSVDGVTPVIYDGYDNFALTDVVVTNTTTGCSTTDNSGWVITAPIAPNADAGQDQTICENGSAQLSAINPGTASVSWSDGTNTYNDGDNVSPVVTTVYTLSVSENGCTITDDMEVVVSTTPTVSIVSSDTSYCEGESILDLTASASSGTITWYDGGSNVVGTGTSYTPSVAVGNQECFTVEADDNGCVSTLSAPVCVTVNALPALPVVSGSSSICSGDVLTLNATGSNLTWYSDVTLSATVSSGATFTDASLSAGNYTFYVAELDVVTGCTNSTPISITVQDNGTFELPDTIEVCSGAPVMIVANATNAVTWSDGSVGDTLILNTTTSTIVSGSMTGACGVSTEQVVVIVNPNPTVEAGANQTVPRGTLVEVEGSGAVSYEWTLVSNTANVDYLNCPTCQRTDGYPLFTSLYVLTGWNEFGCVDTDTLLITIDGEISVYVPNIFSPNNDGENDVFKVMGPDFYTFSFLVFNRWGEVVYESKDATEGWDGTFRGEDTGTGVYMYVVEGRAVSGQDVNLQGSVTLVR